MRFNDHSRLAGRHARILGASKHHWINYDEEKLERAYFNAQASRRGIDMHKLAMDLIKMGVNLPDDPDNPLTINLYVNDAIGYKMIPEQILYYSDECFGTADAICFRQNKLRIHDLKNGINRTSEHQLEIYAALFCLEYEMKPHEIEMELRIYQNNTAIVYIPDPDFIVHIMDKIKLFDKRITQWNQEA